MTTAFAAGAAVALAASGAQAAGTPGWRVVAVYPQVSQMTTVSATSATNAWAVGELSGPCYMCVFTRQWTGTKWRTIAQPPGMFGYPWPQGEAVAAIAGERAWVFEADENEELGTELAGAVEWTGTSWSAVHSFAGQPSIGTAIATGPSDVWGFGTENGAPWVVHYNGKSWSQASIPLSTYDASGSPQAGDWITGNLAAQPKSVEILHWSNGAWRNAALPKISVPTGDQMLPGLIAANTTADIWATIGVGPASGHVPVATVLLHWNGKAWSQALVPNQGNLARLTGLASDGHGGAWVAWNTQDKHGNPTGVLMYHYSSGHWTRVPAPAKAGSVTRLVKQAS